MSGDDLFYKDKKLGVMYFRHFYDPGHFNNDAIEVEAMAHASSCIMIPDPMNFLLSLKTIQHLIYSENMMKKYGLDDFK